MHKYSNLYQFGQLQRIKKVFNSSGCYVTSLGLQFNLLWASKDVET